MGPGKESGQEGSRGHMCEHENAKGAHMCVHTDIKKFPGCSPKQTYRNTNHVGSHVHTQA